MQMSFYIAFLRAMYLFYENAHWQSSGSGSYSNHLMFQRLYENVLERIDPAGEKSICLFGNDVIDVLTQAKITLQILEKHCQKSESSVIVGIELEKVFQTIAIKIRDELKNQGKLTPGLEKLIQDDLDFSENPRLYLLKQNI